MVESGDAPYPRSTTALVVAGTLALIAFHLWTSRHVPGPQLAPDEAGYLGNAHWLAGDGDRFTMGIAPYYGFGYSLVLAPLARVIDDPDRFFQAVLVANAALLASLFPLLHHWVRRDLGVTGSTALLAALTGALVPGAVASSSIALAENLVLPLVVGTVISARSMLGGGRWWRGALFPVAVGLLYATHPRFTALLPVVVVLLAVAAALRVVTVRRAVVHGLVIGALVVAVHAVRDSLIADRWLEVDTPEGSFSDFVDLLTTPAERPGLALEAAGQAWYLLVASLGLAAAGAVLLIRRTGPGRGPPTRPARSAAPLADADRLAAGFVVVVAAAVFVVSTVYFTRIQDRGDHLIYGRHNDSFSPLLVAAGVVALVAAGRTRHAAALLAATAAVIAGLGAWVLAGHETVELTARILPFSIPGVAHLFASEPRHPVGLGTLVGVGVVLALAGAVAIRRPLTVVPVALVWFVVAGTTTANELADSATQVVYRDWRAPEDIRELGVTEVALDATVGVLSLTYQHALPEVRFVPYASPEGQWPARPFVLARLDDPNLGALGGRVAMIDEGGFYSFVGAEAGLALWVLPGPDQDRLAAQGRLLPAGFPAPLPSEARHADLAFDDGETDGVDGEPTLRLRSGDTASLTVRGRHAGRGSPWPDRASFAQPGRVRIGARSVGDGNGPAPFAYRTELPRWIVPGESFAAEAAVWALDRKGRPLPPGRYRVGIDLVQEGYGWFSEPGQEPLALTLVVT